MKRESTLDHIGIVVSDIKRALDFLSRAFDLRLPPRSSSLSRFFKLVDSRQLGTKWALIPTDPLGNTMIEPIEPTREFHVSDFLRTRGEMAVAEFCYRVRDIESFYDRMKEVGMTPTDYSGVPLVDKKYYVIPVPELPEESWLKCFYMNIPTKPGQGPAYEILEYPSSWPRPWGSRSIK
jgi:catechol 2,3-dioxygenase-like lactoylglutathione lyase family enzyme